MKRGQGKAKNRTTFWNLDQTLVSHFCSLSICVNLVSVQIDLSFFFFLVPLHVLRERWPLHNFQIYVSPLQ